MTTLLLAGTSEARKIAQGLKERGRSAIATLAGATRNPIDLGVPTVIGGFGGRTGFVEFLEREGITEIIDATHPFAGRISHRSAEVAVEENVRYLQVLRPEWQISPGDCWEFVRDEGHALTVIPRSACVFLATGRQTLSAFAPLAGQKLYCRQIDPPEKPFPFKGGRYVVGRPPFKVEDEVALFTRLGVDVLVVKNAGGAASRTKLDAARLLGIKVVMIARPAQPDVQRVASAHEALAWLDAL